MAAASELTDKQKIAVLLASLDEKTAASILQQLEPHTMAEVANSIRALGVIPGEVRNECIAHCMRSILEMGNAVRGDETTVNNLLKAAIGEKRASALLQDPEAMTHDAFSFLADAPGDQVAGILSRERPAVIAIVLKFLSAEKAAEILTALPPETRKQAVVFMCTAKPPAPEVIAGLEEFMKSKLGRAGGRAQKIEEGSVVDVVAGILQNVDSTLEEELLTAIEDKAETTAGEIRDKLFTFEDIVNISDVGMRRILQEIDMALLSVALRNASIDLREKFFKNMSKRAGEGIKEEMEFSQKMKLSEIEERQKEIVNIVRGLEAEGQISIGSGGEDEYV